MKNMIDMIVIKITVQFERLSKSKRRDSNYDFQLIFKTILGPRLKRK